MGLVVFIDGNFEPGLSLRLFLCKFCDQQNALWLSLYCIHLLFIWGVSPFCLNYSYIQLFEL